MGAEKATGTLVRTRSERVRRIASLAVVLALASTVLLSYVHPHPAQAVVRTDSGASVTTVAPLGAAKVEPVSGGPGGPPPGPPGRQLAMAHDDRVLPQTDDTSSGTSLPLGRTEQIPDLGLMLLVGLAAGSWIAVAQQFMSRASRTRGQPSMA